MKNWPRHPVIFKRVENISAVKSLCKEIWGPRSEVQCLNCGTRSNLMKRSPWRRTPIFFTLLWIFLFLTLSLWSGQGRTQPHRSVLPPPDSAGRDAQIREAANPQAVGGFDFSWKEGFRLGYQDKDIFKLELGGQLEVDGGYIAANQALQNAYQSTYPPLQGWNDALRSARVKLVGTFYETVEVKVEVEFAQTRELKDAWIASKKKIPVIGYVRAGNMKEPFSLEELTGDPEISFMERSLPTQAFSPGRNVGFMFNNTALNERITWAAGGFYNTGGLNNVYKGGDPQDKWSTANGYSLAARVTGLPWYEEGGRRLLHLGVSYDFRARNVTKDGAEEKFSSRPESYLTNIKFVDTGDIAANRTNLINGELAWVWGPFSLQGEYFRAFTNAQEYPDFRGWYAYGSFFLTGEHRKYNTTDGVFMNIHPHHKFDPLIGGWGAWELAARYSAINLNNSSGGIKGGKEDNVTLGLNWYPRPNLRFIFNYIRVNATNSSVEEGRASIYQARFQLAF
jgi:phosphate-selective porin OprO and OprP